MGDSKNTNLTYNKFKQTKKFNNIALEKKTIVKSKRVETPDYTDFSNETRSYVRKTGLSLNEVHEIYTSDEEVRAFYSILRDAVTKGDYLLQGKESDVKSAREKLNKLKLRKHLKRIVIDALLYKHSFINLVPSKFLKNIVELNILDPARVAPYMDKLGTIDSWGYFLNYPTNTTKTQNDKPTSIKAKEFVHISIDDDDAKFWGVTDIETLRTVLHLKKKLVEHLQLLLDQDWFRPHFHGKNVGDDGIDGFIQMIQLSMQNPNEPIITVGEEDMEAKRFMDETVFLPIIEMLHELRNKILTLIRVPPIIAGTVDNSNRSNSDVQAYFSFTNRVRAIQEDIEDDINYDLLPKLGIKNVTFNFPEVTDRSLMDITTVMLQFISAGADKKMMNDWLIKKGYDVPKDVLPSKEEEQALFDKQQEANNVNLDKNSPLHESRKPQDNTNDNNFGNAKEKNRGDK